MTDAEWQRSGREREPLKGFRVNLVLWNAALVIAELRHESVSGVLRAALRAYVRRHLSLLSPAQRQAVEQVLGPVRRRRKDEADN